MTHYCDRCGLEDPYCNCYVNDLEKRISVIKEKLKMSGECAKCGDHCLECECNENQYDLLGLHRNYFIQMVFPEGYMSKPMVICEQIILSSDDPVLNMAASRLAGNSNGIMILFGLGKTMAFKYEDKKLKQMA